MLHPNAFIDLPNIALPFTGEEILVDRDYEILAMETPDELIKAGAAGIKTKNIWWGARPDNAGQNSQLGLIMNRDLQHSLREFFLNTFNNDLLAPLLGLGPGKKIMPISLITFRDNTPWHREGLEPSWCDLEKERYFHSVFPRRRFNYSINFPLYTEDPNSTRVEFGKPSDKLKTLEHKLMNRLIENRSTFEEEDGVKVSQGIDQIIDEEKWADDMEVVATSSGYDNPYIINLSSYHKVHTTGAKRLSLRFMGDDAFRWSDLEDMYNNGNLLL